MQITSKPTSKGRATVPAPVSKPLKLKTGELVRFELASPQVKMRKITPLDIAFSQALEGTLSEWSSKADDKHFKDL